jgi:hypothetical protein
MPHQSSQYEQEIICIVPLSVTCSYFLILFNIFSLQKIFREVNIQIVSLVSGPEVLVHKTFHCYTVRARQGGTQSSRDGRSGGSHPKSAGASLRRYNEAALIQVFVLKCEYLILLVSAYSTHGTDEKCIQYFGCKT